LPWKDVGADAPKGGDSLPILKIEAGKPVRIRLIDGGGKYSEPAKRFQHWPDTADIKSPIACIGTRSGCLFHAPPLDWRCSASFCMNVMVYTIDPKTKEVTDRKIMAFPAGQQVYGGIKDAAEMVGLDPMAVDWLIARTGTGKNDTKYTVVQAPGDPIDGATLNLEDFPKQAEFADAAVPQLVDYDQFDGYRRRTREEQEAWYNEMLGVAEQQQSLPSSRNAALPASREALPPARPDAIDAEFTETTQSTPPKPKIGLGTPPKPAAAAPPPPKPSPKIMMDPWGEKKMGELDEPTLKYIIETPGFSPEHVAAAKELLGGSAAATNGAESNLDALRKELTQLISTLPSIKEYPQARKFMSIGGAASTKALSAEGLHKLLTLARQGDAAVAAAIAQANG